MTSSRKRLGSRSGMSSGSMSRRDGSAPPWQREHQYSYRRRSLVSGSCAGLKAIVMACPLIYPQLTRSIPDIVAKASRFFQLPLRVTACPLRRLDRSVRSEEHTSELQSLMCNMYAVLCLKKTARRLQKHIITSI